MGTAPDLEARLDRFLASRGKARDDAFRLLLGGLTDALEAGRFPQAAGVLRKAALPQLDYTSAQKLVRLHKRLRASLEPPGKPTRLAILGSCTTTQLRELIELFLFAAGASVEIQEAEYGVFRQEILDPGSELYRFAPHRIFLVTTWRDLARRANLDDSPEAVRDLIEAELADWMALWQTAHDRLGCQIIQNNFDLPPWRTLGNHEMRHPGSLGRFLAGMNQAFQDHAPPFVTVHDLESLSANAGRWAWSDERFVLHAKMPCAPEYLVDYAHSVGSILAAQLALGKKCLVLDLDNTLWGGVIGDDGIGGIRLGQGDAEGEAFLAFQRYCKALRLRGVILAVCSKNTESIAKEPFEKHPEMVLGLDDFSCFVANWDDKPGNLMGIAETLNIGLSSFVLIDDNPAERAIVRQMAPEVAVPEVTADPIDFIRALEQHRYFQISSLSTEDYRRTDYYRANAARRRVETSATSITDFLKSLDMVAAIGPIDSASLERSAQLINRSNQFNLTTRRRSAAELMAITEDADWITRTVRLTDRFGDNGLISVLLARVAGGELAIDTWLMSCRVLKRGVERLLMNHLWDLARRRGIPTVVGEYLPTAKNGLVADHYADLGFERISSGPDGRSRWKLTVSEWQPLETFIEEKPTVG